MDSFNQSFFFDDGDGDDGGEDDQQQDKSLPQRLVKEHQHRLAGLLPSLEDHHETVDVSGNDDPDDVDVDKLAVSDSFNAFKLSRPIQSALSVLGLLHPTPIQKRCIPEALAGRDVLGLAKTGSGKTAAFLVPCLERLLHRSDRIPGCRVLILLPTRELAQQCYRMVRKLTHQIPSGHIRVALLIGGKSNDDNETWLSPSPEMIIATPGRLLYHISLGTVSLSRVDILVLDEADRMLEEGFEHELVTILSECPRSDRRQTLLFSATESDAVAKFVTGTLRDPVRIAVDQPGTLVSSLMQHFVKVKREQDRAPLLLMLLHRNVSHGAIIVFIPTKEQCHRFFLLYQLSGIQAKAVELHGAQSQPERTSSLDQFRSGSATVLFCTDVAARGLDVPNVALVLNYDLTAGVDRYTHRVGRTARAGTPGTAISLAGEADRRVMRQIGKRSQHPIIVDKVDSVTLKPYILVMQQAESILNNNSNNNS